jgi:hypothetical protein
LDETIRTLTLLPDTGQILTAEAETLAKGGDVDTKGTYPHYVIPEAKT